MRGWLIFLFASTLMAQTPFDRGCELYKKGNYKEAIEIWESQVQEGYEDYRLYYNLGNAYYRSGNLGKAILWYERAKKLKPAERRIEENLAYVRLRLKDRFPETKNSVVVSFLRHLYYLFSLSTLSLLVLGFFGLFHLLWFFYLFTHRPALKTFLLYGMTFVGMLFLVLAIFFGIHLYQAHGVHYGVVLVPSAQGKSAPQEEGTTLFVVHEGTKVRLHERVGGWQRVSLPNGLTGFLPLETFEPI